jgi:plastocyanin
MSGLMPITRPHRARPFVVAVLALASGLSTASSLTITVTDKDGQPVPDTAVLLRYAVAPATRPAPVPNVVIEQEKLRFQPYLTIVTPGTTVLFTNRDAFDHHVVATLPQVGSEAPKSFETRLPPDPSKPFAVTMTEPGRHALSCHLHSRMRGYVYVSDTPWFGKTDARGQVKIDAPDGLVEVQAWHPEQFADQPKQRSQLGAAPAALSTQLNFTPRVRRSS